MITRSLKTLVWAVVSVIYAIIAMLFFLNIDLNLYGRTVSDVVEHILFYEIIVIPFLILAYFGLIKSKKNVNYGWLSLIGLVLAGAFSFSSMLAFDAPIETSFILLTVLTVMLIVYIGARRGKYDLYEDYKEFVVAE